MKHHILLVSLATLAGACNGPRASAPAPSTTANPAERPSSPPEPAKPAMSTHAAAAPAAARAWTFDGDAVAAAPAGFSFGVTGGGRAGRFVVRAEPGAPSGANVLAQLDLDRTDYRFPFAVAVEPTLADVRVSVRCRAVSGKVDRACGLVFRFRDADNYYVTRANALENNVRLYHVVKGDRQQFAGWNGDVKSGVWHSLRADAKGDHFEVYFDDAKIIDARDTTFAEAGKVGVWTKADSVTYFDDLVASPL
jgi:hypothetical protein